jgi:galactokinase
MMDMVERKAMIGAKFREFYGAEPEVWARAPGRVDLMGSHTDYNMGYVMTMTIDRDTWIAARPRKDRKVVIRSMNLAGRAEFDLEAIEHDPNVRWSDYVRGMAKSVQEAGHALVGFDGLVQSTVPFGSGLSSSAAIEMATGIVLQQVGGFTLDPVQMALLGQKAENRFVGVNSGILDQFSSAMGREGCAILLDCRNLTGESKPISPDLKVVICDTRAVRSLAGSEYSERRAQCEAGVRILQAHDPQVRALRDVSLEQFAAHEKELPQVVARRCRFIIEENQRVLDLAEALPAGDGMRLARLLAFSYAGARDLFEIGAPAMEAMMNAMLSAPGVVGARQAGAGFGGCMDALVRSDAVDAFKAHVHEAYRSATGLVPAIYAVQAVMGAGIVE